ncbi:glycogen synthase [Seongchinamella unica]|uniref:starch synthase n=1 Tax=Seongchinamella unica TaxID=2547392 RepID=A0A4R5LUC9_9GAMM|nr:glycogen/starch synthase [Seongchinamella unica]TDG14917.1 glycogen synthase [Seongchinamella unica]
MKILMVAAENGAFPGGKVGGMGDVIRDVPPALAALGHQVSVVMPGYQYFSTLSGAQRISELQLRFRGRIERVGLWRVEPEPAQPGVKHWVLEHPLLAPQGAGKIYCDDGPERPFATDASKFALFCGAVLQALSSRRLEVPDIIHLHDWHSALVAVLARYDKSFQLMPAIPMVYTIHNLALQGIRPFSGDESALDSWYGAMDYPADLLADPRYPDCFNPARAAINLCHRVHAVSPTYVREIQQPDPAGDAAGGGAGLEADLRRAAEQGRLVGILNGCEYPDKGTTVLPFTEFIDLARERVLQWLGKSAAVLPSEFLALRKLDQWLACGAERPGLLLTSVGRVTPQKVGLLLRPLQDGRSALVHMLETLGDSGVFILLGSGDPELEHALAAVSASHENFLFLRGYSEPLSDQLYAEGDLFVMPSSFEPCGISQMLAMRAGQPCLVHAVGGLADTVVDGDNGFSFKGATLAEEGEQMLLRFREVLTLKREQPARWQEICASAAAARFPWDKVASAYVEQLYLPCDKAAGRG